MSKPERRDLSGWHGIILAGIFILNCFLLNQLFFFIPDSMGWMNEAIRLNDDSYFMPLRTALCLVLSLPLTLYEIGLYFRLKKKRGR